MDGVVKEIRNSAAGLVVDVTGEITLDQSPKLHKHLLDLVEQRPGRLVINLTEVTHIDSSGVGTLVDTYRHMHAQGGKLLLFGMNPRVRGVFEITKLDRFFTIVGTEQEALAS